MIDINHNAISYFPKKTRVFYVGVSGMSQASAQSYLEKLRYDLNPDTTQYENFFVPDQESYRIVIEVLD